MICNEPYEDGRCKDCSNLEWCPYCGEREESEEGEWNVLQQGEERCPPCKERYDEEVEKEVSKPLGPVLRTACRAVV